MPQASPPPTGPLAGLRVIDLSTVLAGPYATMLLADLGADVVKVEPPEGDATRGWGPPWVGDEAAGTRTAAYYLAVNRNKRSVRLDIRQGAGADILRRLLADADVLVENLRPGSLARLGFDEETLRDLNPDLVHLAISGYGPDGPAAERPGYDFVIQAVGGLMSITGDADADGGHPTKVGVAISDIVAGLFATVGILAGLLARRSDGPVRGQRDRRLPAGVHAGRAGQPGAERLRHRVRRRVAGATPIRTSSRTRPSPRATERSSSRSGPSGSGRASAPRSGRRSSPTTRGSPRMATASPPAPILRPLIAERLVARSSEAWLAALTAADIPCAPITDVLTAFQSPEATARSMLVEVEHPAFGVLRQAGIPIEFAATPGTVRTAPPLLGEHTDEVLAELGIDGDEVRRLRAQGVV